MPLWQYIQQDIREKQLPGMYIRLFILFIVLFTNTAAHAGYEGLLHRSYAQRYEDIDTTFFRLRHAGYDSSRYFKELDLLQQMALREGDKELALEARWLHAAYYRNGSQRSPALLPGYVNALLADAEKQGNKQISMRCYLLLALYYFEMKQQYAPAIRNCLRCYRLLHDIPANEFPNKKEPLTNIATMYYGTGDFIEAEKMFREADAVPMKLAPGSQKGFVYLKLYEGLALICKQRKSYDTALLYFSKGLAMARQMKNDNWVRIFTTDMATVFLEQGDAGRALAIVDEGVKHFEPKMVNGKFYDCHEIYNYCKVIAAARMIKQDHAGALPYLQECRNAACYSGKDQYFERLHEVYRMTRDCYTGIGNKAMASVYADSAFLAEDSSYTRQRFIELSHINLNAQTDIFEAEMASAHADREIQLLWRNASIVIILLISVILLLFIQSRRIKDRQKNTRLEGELKAAAVQLYDFTKSIQEKNELIDRFTIEIAKYQSLPCSNDLPDREEYLQALKRSVILTEEQWVEFQQVFEKVHPGYIERIRARFPEITMAELRFVLFTKLGITGKQMAALLGVTYDAVRVNKSRLLKKIQLPEDISPEEFFKNI